MKKYILAIILLAVGNVFAAPVVYFPLDNLQDAAKNQVSKSFSGKNMLLDKHSIVPGVKGNAMQTTGVGDGICVDLKQIPVKGSASISFFFRADYLGNNRQMTLVSFWKNPNTLLALKIKDGRLTLMDWNNYSNRITRPFGEKIVLHKWYHILWQMTGKEWKVFVNGKLAATFAIKSTIDSFKPQKMLLANDFNHVVAVRDHFCGVMDEFKLFSGLVNADTFSAEIKKLDKASKFTGHAFPGAKNIKPDEKPIISRLDPATQQFIFNGKPQPVMMYAIGTGSAYTYTMDTLPEAFQSGMKVFRIDVSARDFRRSEWWYGNDKYDFEGLDLTLDAIFRQVPDAYIILQIGISPPVWWGRANPNEETRGYTGKLWRDYKASHSFSSEKWLIDTEKAFKAFFDHYKKTPYYKRTIGYVTIIGRYNEAFRWGYNSSNYQALTDYSTPELLGYRKYLQKRYGSVDKLNAARPMDAPLASFEAAYLPTPEARMKRDGYFVHPQRERNVIDYRMYWNDNHAEKIDRFTGIIRKFTGKDTIMGLYYGYVFSDAHGHNRTFSNESGHYGLAKVLRSKNIDFLMDSMVHAQREIGNTGPTAGAPAANAMHGKLWLDEADIRTHLSGGAAEYSGARTMSDSLAVLWRAFGTIQVNYSGLWWFPINGKNAYSDPLIWNAFTRMYKEMEYTAQHPVKADRKNTVAIIMDPQSIHFRHYSKNDSVCGNIITGLLGPIAKAGFAYDIHLIEDIEIIPDDYKTYIFINSFYLSEAQRNIIKKRFAKNNNLLAFTYAAGYFTGNSDNSYSCSLKNMQDLLQMNIVLSNDKNVIPDGKLAADLSGNPLTVDAKNPTALYPLFYVDDPAVKTLATFNKGSLLGKTASAVKQQNGYRTAYIGIPLWTPELLRGLAKIGGTHVYSSDVPVYVLRPGNGHILLHTAPAVKANIKLPRKVKRVYDVINDKEIARNCDAFSINMSKRSTSYLRIEE